jgi:Fic family protein
MDPKDFRSSEAGQVLHTRKGYWAFIPAPLPPHLAWELPLISALSDAERDLSRLTTLAGAFPFPRLLVQPFVRREAVLSSRIEGTRASLVDLFTYESTQMPLHEPQDNDVREVYNYVRALEFGMERLKTLPVSLRLIREVHAKLLENVRGGNLTPGEFRHTQNWIGSPVSTIESATLVPPPVDEMLIALDQLEKFIHEESDIPDLIKAAMIHYQFEAIHPFLDGNGRIGRLLIILLLCESNMLPQPLLNLSVHFEHYRQEYYDHLLAVSQRGDWDGWIRFFLRGVSEQAQDGVVRVNRLGELRTKFQKIADSDRNPERMEQVLDFLFMRPIFSVRQLSLALESNYPTAQRYIVKLVELGVLHEITGYARNRIFRADEIFKAVEGIANPPE